LPPAPGAFDTWLVTHRAGASRVRPVSVNRSATSRNRVEWEIETAILRNQRCGSPNPPPRGSYRQFIPARQLKARRGTQHLERAVGAADLCGTGGGTVPAGHAKGGDAPVVGEQRSA
jgi:hypothetical protein